MSARTPFPCCSSPRRPRPAGLAAKLDEQDACLWETSDGLKFAVRLAFDDEVVTLTASLAPWPSLTDDDDRVLRALFLEANLAGVGSRGGVFAIDDGEDATLYRRLVLSGVDADRLAAAIDDLCVAAREAIAELISLTCRRRDCPLVRGPLRQIWSVRARISTCRRS